MAGVGRETRPKSKAEPAKSCGHLEGIAYVEGVLDLDRESKSYKKFSTHLPEEALPAPLMAVEMSERCLPRAIAALLR